MKISTVDACLLTLLAGSDVSTEVSCSVDLNEALWMDVATQAKKLGVASFLYHRFKDDTSSIPAPVLHTLQNASHVTAFRNKMIYTTVATPLSAFHAHGIPVIVLKGVYLAEAVYGNIALRPMQDADILVKQHDIPRVEEILLRLGFDPPEHPRIRNHRTSRVVFHKMGGASIEVHWILDRPGGQFLIDHQGLWSRSCPIIIAGAHARCLSPEDLLLHICWQTSVNKLFRKGLYPFLDIHATINRFRDMLDWNAFLLRARQWNFTRCAYVTLFFAKEFFKADIPHEVLVGMQPSELDPHIITYARQQIFAPPPRGSNFLRMGSAMRRGEKSRVIIKKIFPCRATIEKKYSLPAGAMRTYLYYPAYWKNLFTRYSARTLKMIKRDRTMASQIESQCRQDKLQRWLHYVEEDGERLK